MYVRATDGTIGGSSKAEIIFSRECEAVLLKLRNFSGSGMMADKEKLFKSLIPAIDGKGKSLVTFLIILYAKIIIILQLESNFHLPSFPHPSPYLIEPF